MGNWLVCTASVFASRRNHHWNCNLQSGCIWLFLHICCSHLELCAFGLLGLKGASFFLVTKTGKVSKLMAKSTLEFLHRALKSFHMGGIFTL